MLSCSFVDSILQALASANHSNNTGILYGLLSGHVLTVCGYSPQNLDDNTWVEKANRLSEHLPAGIEPIGVFAVVENVEAQVEEVFGDVDFSESSDINILVIIVPPSNDHEAPALRVYLSEDTGCNMVPSEVIEAALFRKSVNTLRVKGQMQLSCLNDLDDLRHAFGSFQTMSVSGACIFHIPSTGLILHSYGSETPNEEEIQKEFGSINSIDALWSSYAESSDSSPKKKKGSGMSEKDCIEFQLLFSSSLLSSSSQEPDCSPIVKYDKTNSESLKIPLNIDAIAVVMRREKLTQIPGLLCSAVFKQLSLFERALSNQMLTIPKLLNIPETFHFSPDGLLNLISVVYSETVPDADLGGARQKLHDMFHLPCDKPLLRRSNYFRFSADNSLPSGRLLNPHLSVEAHRVDNGKLATVRGDYLYYHYMQDGIDDNHWGCAYRSLQTIYSWFKLNGYTDTEVPTHHEIQECLVKIGDKQPKFVDSREWIGSTEVGFCVESLLNVSYKCHFVSSGSDLNTKGRDLLQHFETQGTPVMIGGGVLAHTIIGVDFCDTSGEIKFLILDPHYTGNDNDLGRIIKQGWVNWKGIDFWDANSFYNMCLPQRPQLF